MTLCNDVLSNFECWQYGGELDSAIICEDEQCYAILGSPDYNCEGGVPVGEAWMKQTFQVLREISPTISLDYRVFSYDLGFPYDYFLVAINGKPFSQGYGNDEWNEPSCEGKFWDSGRQTLTLDLSDYREEEIEISFHNVNNTEHFYNTWTYVHDVRIDTTN